MGFLAVARIIRRSKALKRRGWRAQGGKQGGKSKS